jgi:hypothetical protein
MCITAGEHSLAGQLLQGKSDLAFVGASLLANRAHECASPQANIRWQASSYKGKAILPL